MDEDGRTTEHLYTRISVPCEPNGSGEPNSSGELKVIVSHFILHLLNHRVWFLVRAVLKTVHIAGRICNNFEVNHALFDKSMKLGTWLDL